MELYILNEWSQDSYISPEETHVAFPCKIHLLISEMLSVTQTLNFHTILTKTYSQCNKVFWLHYCLFDLHHMSSVELNLGVKMHNSWHLTCILKWNVFFIGVDITNIHIIRLKKCKKKTKNKTKQKKRTRGLTRVLRAGFTFVFLDFKHLSPPRALHASSSSNKGWHQHHLLTQQNT